MEQKFENNEIVSEKFEEKADYVFVPKKIASKGSLDKITISGFGVPTEKDLIVAFLKSIKKTNKLIQIDLDEHFHILDFASYRNSEKAIEKPVVSAGEFVRAVKSVESGWFAIEICDKQLPKIVKRIVFVSNGGFGFDSHDFDSFKKKQVPKDLYMRSCVIDPQDFVKLDEKYYVGDARDDKFVEDYYELAQKVLNSRKEEYEKLSDFLAIQCDICIEENEEKLANMKAKRFE